jgi:GntR family transcriptional regulator
MLNLDLQSRVPIFEQIKTGITRLIYLGVLAADEQLPTVRALAEQLGVNPNTVQKAYQQLEAGGLIYPVSGRGSFVKPGLAGTRPQQERILASLRQLACEARAALIPESLAVLAVREVYSESASEVNKHD